LTFSLGTGTPDGATITPSGVFSWTPTQAQALANYLVTIIVTDNGSPTTTDSETLIITVAEAKQTPSRPSEPWQQYWYLVVAGAVSAVAIPILVKKIPRTKTLLPAVIKRNRHQPGGTTLIFNGSGWDSKPTRPKPPGTHRLFACCSQWSSHSERGKLEG